MNTLHAKVSAGQEAAISRAVEGYAADRGFADRRDDVRTAVEEACRNALEHGEGTARLRAQTEGGRLIVAVTSGGGPFTMPEGQPDLEAKLDGRERPRGWGLFLIQSLADRVDVQMKDGENTLTMEFRKGTSEDDHG